LILTFDFLDITGTSVFGMNQAVPTAQPTNVFGLNLTGTTVKFNPVSAQGKFRFFFYFLKHCKY